jgi:L-asparaginase II
MSRGECAPALLAVSYRGAVAEAEHYGHVAVAGPVAASLGDPEKPTVLRSAAKPLQALSVVTSGAARRFDLDPRHLAICCASHSGSAAHLATVREILARLGLDESALACGAHWPDDAAEFDRLKRAGLQPSALHNNCSGKHAGMLATSLALGAPVAGYLAPEHPTQALIRAHLAALSGAAEASLEPLVDGCSAPTYALPLRAIATAFGRLARPEGLPADLAEAAEAISAAINAYPEMVQSEEHFSTALLRAWPGALVAKGGAEGLYAFGLRRSGVGVALKVADGASRAWPVLVLELLGRGGEAAPEGLAGFARAEQTNCRGTVVGRLHATPEVAGLIPPSQIQLEATP